MNIQSYLDSIFHNKERLPDQLIKECYPTTESIQKNNYSGYIRQKLLDGFQMESQWFQGKRDGVSIIVKQGVVVVKMVFKSGFLNGNVLFINKNEIVSVEYNMGAPTGKVKIVKAGRVLFSGTYQMGKPSGECVCEDDKGHIYKGNMVLGKPKGYGKLYMSENEMAVEGEWINGACGLYTFSFTYDLMFIQRETPRSIPNEPTKPSLLSSLKKLSPSSYKDMVMNRLGYQWYKRMYMFHANNKNSRDFYKDTYLKGKQYLEQYKELSVVLQDLKKKANTQQYNRNSVLSAILAEKPKKSNQTSNGSNSSSDSLYNNFTVSLHGDVNIQLMTSFNDDSESVSSEDEVENHRGRLNEFLQEQIIQSDDEDISLLQRMQQYTCFFKQTIVCKSCFIKTIHYSFHPFCIY